jgi:hypothetical protein
MPKASPLAFHELHPISSHFIFLEENLGFSFFCNIIAIGNEKTERRILEKKNFFFSFPNANFFAKYLQISFFILIFVIGNETNN